jgi:hypothetical protein
MTTPPSPESAEPPTSPGDDLGEPEENGSSSPAPRRSPLEYLLLRESIDEQRRQISAEGGAGAADLGRAETAFSAAMRLLDPADPFPSGPTPHLVLLLLREAAFWSFRSLRIPGETLESQLDQAPAELLVFIAGGEDSLAKARTLLLGSGHEEALRPVTELEHDAQEATKILQALLKKATEPQRKLEHLLLLRTFRIGVAVGLLGGVIGLVLWVVSIVTTPPDLLAGKVWHASSSYKNYNPTTRIVDGNSTEIFFHTNEEMNPWVEFDLAHPALIKSITVKNRSDCCSERAIPLVVEVSQDRSHWKEVARRNEDFRQWTSKISPQQARYVRIRSLRKTWLHLEKVHVR